MLTTKPGREQLFGFVLPEIGYLNRRAQLPSPYSDNGVTIFGCYRGPRRTVQASLRRQRVLRDRTDPLALSDDIQILDFIVIVQTTKLGFFMRDTDSHQRVFVI